MTEETRKSYNLMALQGQNIDDMDFAATNKLDVSLAYTPAINDAMIEKAYRDNYKGYMEQGYTDSEAKQKAGQAKREATERVKMAMKNQ